MPSFEEKKVELDVALRNREFEIQLFWQRSNYFLVLITALGIGFFSIEELIYKFFLSLFGLIACLLWYNTNLGSRFWQVFWEHEVESLAKEFDVASFQKTTTHIKGELKSSMAHSESKHAFRKWIDKEVVRKPSVTISMIYLSIWAMVFWALLLLANLCQLIAKIFC